MRKHELESFLRQTQADQGGQASFEDWLRCTAEEETEYGHDEAKEYLALGGDVSDKVKDASGAWVSYPTILGITGNREVSAFRMADLAAAAGMTVLELLYTLETDEGEEVLTSAIMQAEPLERAEAPRGGSEEQCFHNLSLTYPGAIRADDLFGPWLSTMKPQAVTQANKKPQGASPKFGM